MDHIKHPGSPFAAAALILGLLSIVTAVLGTVYPPLVFGGLAIILAILSKKEPDKYYFISYLGMVLNSCIIAMVSMILYAGAYGL